eukprot:jgi/Chlat1/3714/Chrsp251S03868
MFSCRFIRWVQEAYPEAGAQSELLPILEKCARAFQHDTRYADDVRYLRVWILYADCCSEPQDVFAFLEANNIGQSHSLFYAAYATCMELRHNFKRAQEVYELGLAR